MALTEWLGHKSSKLKLNDDIVNKMFLKMLSVNLRDLT